jgi:hypothetical protein
MTDSYVVRFVGRFVFAYQGPQEGPTSVAALAINMGFNQDLGCEAHRVMLTAPRPQVEVVGVRRADLTLFSPTQKPSERAQVLVWDLAGHDIRLAEGATGGLSLNTWETVPDLKKLSQGTLRHDVLSATPQRSPIASRLFVSSGALMPVFFDPNKRVAFEPYGETQPQLPDKGVPLPDAVDLAITTDGPLTLRLTRHADEAASSVAILPARSAADSPVVVTVTNLCTRSGSDDDREFAAYYDLLSSPVQARRRRVPFNVAGPQMGRHADCTGIATVGY